MTMTTSEPPVGMFPQFQEAAPEPKRRIALGLAILLMVAALAVGAGAGYAGGIPQRNDLQDQKKTALAERDTARSDLAATNQDLVAANDQLSLLKDQLAAAQSSAQSASSARDLCTTAANDARDLITQWENLMSDFAAYANTPLGSAAEAEILAHINEQAQTMDTQSATVESEMSACTSAIG